MKWSKTFVCSSRFLLCDFELCGLFSLSVVALIGVLAGLVWLCFVVWFWVMRVVWFVVCGFGWCFGWFGSVGFCCIMLGGVDCLTG